MKRRALASDVALAVLDASFRAISEHYGRVFGDFPPGEFSSEYFVAKAMERGYSADLSDRVEGNPGAAFDHDSISRVFYSNLHPLLRGARKDGRIIRGVDKHIWGQDYE